MADGIRFDCDSCGFATEAWSELWIEGNPNDVHYLCLAFFLIESWSDGNPFYIDEKGKKVYAYHPDHDELIKCIANDVPHLCLACGKQVKIDSRLEAKACTQCRSSNVVETYRLEGVECPKCKKGHFRQEEWICRIS